MMRYDDENLTARVPDDAPTLTCLEIAENLFFNRVEYSKNIGHVYDLSYLPERRLWVSKFKHSMVFNIRWLGELYGEYRSAITKDDPVGRRTGFYGLLLSFIELRLLILEAIRYYLSVLPPNFSAPNGFTKEALEQMIRHEVETVTDKVKNLVGVNHMAILKTLSQNFVSPNIQHDLSQRIAEMTGTLEAYSKLENFRHGTNTDFENMCQALHSRMLSTYESGEFDKLPPVFDGMDHYHQFECLSKLARLSALLSTISYMNGNLVGEQIISEEAFRAVEGDFIEGVSFRQGSQLMGWMLTNPDIAAPLPKYLN